jgi:hypothetical protein
VGTKEIVSLQYQYSNQGAVKKVKRASLSQLHNINRVRTSWSGCDALLIRKGGYGARPPRQVSVTELKNASSIESVTAL